MPSPSRRDRSRQLGAGARGPERRVPERLVAGPVGRKGADVEVRLAADESPGEPPRLTRKSDRAATSIAASKCSGQIRARVGPAAVGTASIDAIERCRHDAEPLAHRNARRTHRARAAGRDRPAPACRDRRRSPPPGRPRRSPPAGAGSRHRSPGPRPPGNRVRPIRRSASHLRHGPAANRPRTQASRSRQA